MAIFSVILFHIFVYISTKLKWPQFQTDPLFQIVSQGHFGVQLFFVISGFILSKPFAEAHLFNTQAPPLKKYFLRRLTRLEPPYVINLFILFALIPFVNGTAIGTLFPRLIASLFYQHNLIYGETSAINCVAWSLEVEVQFYLLAPMLACLFKIRGKNLRRGIAIASIFFSALGASYIPLECPRLQLSIFNYLHYFASGFLLADFYILDWSVPSKKRILWDIGTLAGTLLVVLLLLAGAPYSRAANVVLPFAVVLAYAGVFRGVFISYILTQPVIPTIGGMCYTIYLYHYAIVSAAGRVVLKVYSPVWSLRGFFFFAVLIIGAVIVVVCAMLFVFLERPFMRKTWLQNLFRPASREIAET